MAQQEITVNLKFVIGLLLGLAIGVGCRGLGIPSPAPPVLVGALLVVAMTAGYQLTDRALARRRPRRGHAVQGTSGVENDR